MTPALDRRIGRACCLPRAVGKDHLRSQHPILPAFGRLTRLDMSPALGSPLCRGCRSLIPPPSAGWWPGELWQGFSVFRGQPSKRDSNAKYPWGRRGILFWLVDFKGKPFPKKEEEGATGQLGGFGGTTQELEWHCQQVAKGQARASWFHGFVCSWASLYANVSFHSPSPAKERTMCQEMLTSSHEAWKTLPPEERGIGCPSSAKKKALSLFLVIGEPRNSQSGCS